MALASPGLTSDPLFLACTRPAMFLGVPMEAAGVNAILSGLIFLAGGSLAYLLVAPAFHLVARAVCKTDPNAFRLLLLGLETRGRRRNGAFWGGGSLSPLPLVRRYRAEALRHG